MRDSRHHVAQPELVLTDRAVSLCGVLYDVFTVDGANTRTLAKRLSVLASMAYDQVHEIVIDAEPETQMPGIENVAGPGASPADEDP